MGDHAVNWVAKTSFTLLFGELASEDGLGRQLSPLSLTDELSGQSLRRDDAVASRFSILKLDQDLDHGMPQSEFI